MLEDVLKPGKLIGHGNHKLCYAYGDDKVILAGDPYDLDAEQQALYMLARYGFPALRVERCQFWHEDGEPVPGLLAPRYQHHLLLWTTLDPKLYLQDLKTLEAIRGKRLDVLWEIRNLLLYHRIDIEDLQLLIGGPAGEPDLVICDPSRVRTDVFESKAAEEMFTLIRAVSNLTNMGEFGRFEIG